MWKMMLNCLQKPSVHGYSGWDVMRLKLLEQFEEVDVSGVSYMLNEKEVRESHFNFQPLIHALQHYIEDLEGGSSLKASEDYWCTVIGLAQRNVPAHVAQEYCRVDRSFFPRPLFDDPELPRCITFFNCLTGVVEAWWSADSIDNRLGVDFAIYRGGASHEAYGTKGCHIEKSGVSYFRIDLAALIALCNARLHHDMSDLRTKLTFTDIALDEESCSKMP